MVYARRRESFELKRPLPCFCLKIPTGGGKTLLAVKTIDLVHNQYLKRQTGLVVWMLPSASRANKEALRMFRDSGAFQAFFPAEDDLDEHARLLKRVPNLQTFEKEDAFWGRQVKTSLGNETHG